MQSADYGHSSNNSGCRSHSCNKATIGGKTATAQQAVQQVMLSTLLRTVLLIVIAALCLLALYSLAACSTRDASEPFEFANKGILVMPHLLYVEFWPIEDPSPDHPGIAALSEGGYNVFVNDGRDDRMIRQTLIIYSDQTRPQVAKDIQLKLGGGRVIANEGRFGFDGNVLVIEANLPLIVKSLSNRGSFVAIRNGWGVENASRDVSASLFIEGWQITELGSMPSFHHNKTTVVYRSNDDHPEALLIADYLRCGFVMPALGRYHFDGDILVIIGEDLEVPTPRHGQSNFYP